MALNPLEAWQAADLLCTICQKHGQHPDYFCPWDVVAQQWNPGCLGALDLDAFHKMVSMTTHHPLMKTPLIGSS